MPKQTFYNLPDEKRNNILSVSIKEFAERGYEQASISHIVAESGIAKGSFYQYFDDKDDLYEYIFLTEIANRKLKAFKDNEELLESMNLTEFLRHVFRVQVRDFINNPDITKMAMDFNKNTSDPIYKKIMGRYAGVYDSYFVGYIRSEKEQGQLDPLVDETLLNLMLLSLGDYVIKWLSAGSAEYNSITEAQVDMLVDKMEYILTNGIYMKYIGAEEG